MDEYQEKRGFGPQRGRSYTKYSYTLQDISMLSGLTVATLRTYKNKQKFNPHDLHSVIKLITTARKWEQYPQKLTVATPYNPPGDVIRKI